MAYAPTGAGGMAHFPIKPDTAMRLSAETAQEKADVPNSWRETWAPSETRVSETVSSKSTTARIRSRKVARS